MTTAELIALLSTQPPERVVLVDGYEGGFDDINSTKEIDVTEATDDIRMHTEAYADASDQPTAPSSRVLVLGRDKH